MTQDCEHGKKTGKCGFLTRLYPEPPLLIRRCVGGDDVPVGLQLGSTMFFNYFTKDLKL